MSQVIVYTNATGNVSICFPTGEIPIEEVLAKDCPPGAIIIDIAELPPLDDVLFNAWTIKDGKVVIELDAAKTLRTGQINTIARTQLQQRQANDALGIPNVPDDATWMEELKAAREAVLAATTIDEVRDVTFPPVLPT